ncbi:glycosyltransferase [Moraxella osloensis]|nr:glycosyltransferase [Moraxella osloensis]
MRFSIIVPVYNVENYLDACLKSILAQSFTDYEVIVVNDGSTDSSKNICEYYTHKYSHIKLIDKINGGLSDARNYGINNANGEYLIFLDSDDFWNYDLALEEINRIINRNKEIDLIIFGHTQFDDGEVNIKETVFPTLQIKSGEFEADLDYLIEKKIYKAAAWDKVVKKSILVNNQIYFPINKIHEDAVFLSSLVLRLDNIYFSDKKIYNYRYNMNGSLLLASSKNVQKNINSYKFIINYFYNEIRNNNFYSISYVISLQTYLAYLKDKKGIFAMIKAYYEFFDYHKYVNKKLLLNRGNFLFYKFGVFFLIFLSIFRK